MSAATAALPPTLVSSHQKPSRGRVLGIDHKVLKPGQESASGDLGLDGWVRSDCRFAQDLASERRSDHALMDVRLSARDAAVGIETGELGGGAGPAGRTVNRPLSVDCDVSSIAVRGPRRFRDDRAVDASQFGLIRVNNLDLILRCALDL